MRLGLLAVAWLCATLPALAAVPPLAPGRAGLPPPTPLEAAYSSRAGEPLRAFGYDIFQAAPAAEPPLPDALQDDHVLAPGDELTVTLRGQRNASHRLAIDGSGQIVLDELRPITAAGRPLGAVRAEIEADAKAALPLTEVFVSLAAIRRIPVTVLGEVARPGRTLVGGSGTVLDALLAAGGVSRTGSLRRIQVIGGAERWTVDLYDLLLTGGGEAERRLRGGERILVPPVGPTIAVAGAVKRPGVYELANSPLPTAREALALAGGPLRPGALRLLGLGYGPDGAESARPVEDPAKARMKDGDLLLVTPARDGRTGSVMLLGHVRQPGPRALDATGTLAGLLDAAELLPAPYLPFAVLESTDPDSLARTLTAVDLGAVLAGAHDRPLRADDALVVLGGPDIEFLTSRPVLALLKGQPPPPAIACSGLAVLARRLSADPDGVLAAGPLARGAAALVPADLPCPPVFDGLPDLLSFALDHAVLLRRGVPRPGFYPVASDAALASLAEAAGLAPGAEDREMAVFAGPEGGPAPRTPTARPGDIVEDTAPRFTLAGHVRHPGTRPLAPGETLRSVLGDGRQALPGVYPLFAVIERFDRRNLVGRLIPFSLHDVVNGRADRRLEDGDRVRLFSAAELEAMVAGTAARDAEAARLQALARERSATVLGAVRRPGAYPVAETVPLSVLIDTAGGLSAQADPASVEVNSERPADHSGRLRAERRRIDLTSPTGGLAEIAWGDILRIGALAGERESRAVAILGEVRHPGEYDLIRGETLSALIARAGGLTEQAYPAGAVFTRESARRQEEASFERVARELDRGLALVLLGPEPPPAEHVAMARQLASDLRAIQAVGRLTVEADPAVLADRPELDILLEPGDRIVIPRRPLTVTVSGEVLAPATLQFAPDKTAADYLREAGGTTRWADTRRAFVLLPNGAARPLAASPWKHDPVMILPGSSIIVPRDPKPFDFLALSTGVAGILGQLAISAASLAVIAD